MRTTVDLPREVHERAKRRGLASLGEPATLSTDPVSGLPTLTLGHQVTTDDVAEALDDE